MRRERRDRIGKRFLNHQIFDINKKDNLENRETYTKKVNEVSVRLEERVTERAKEIFHRFIFHF